MLTSQRKALILDRLRHDGEIVAKALAKALDLSEDTIRRDLRELAADGLLKRVHGGALPLQPSLPDFQARQAIDLTAKAVIGRRAAALVAAGQVVFLDGGTTTAEIAKSLALACTVITHSPTIATLLADKPDIDVIMIGGSLYRHSMVATGAATLDAIGQIRADVFFMGVTGVHPVDGLTTGDFEEALIKRRIAERSGETYVLATEEKLDVVSPFRISGLERVSALIVPAGGAEAKLAAYRAAGVEAIVAAAV